ncbi:MAG TPA: hypothetical protein VKN99_27660 [Polyangia bacterium]|nr:hypothetical protein [Polyangia bacterium]
MTRPLAVLACGAALCLADLPVADAGHPPTPAMFRCLRRVRPAALSEGADLPVDCGGGEMPHTPCAARCEGRCWLRGDFDGDGQAREVAVTQIEKGEANLWIMRPGEAARWQPAAVFPLSDADEVALISATRTAEIAQANLAVRGNHSPFKLAAGDYFAFGLVTWKRGDRAWDGRLMAVIFNKASATYRVAQMLDLEAAH